MNSHRQLPANNSRQRIDSTPCILRKLRTSGSRTLDLPPTPDPRTEIPVTSARVPCTIVWAEFAESSLGE
ncbi:hypothetical protein J6590_096197, partial [Homalodisca vitripennis]